MKVFVFSGCARARKISGFRWNMRRISLAERYRKATGGVRALEWANGDISNCGIGKLPAGEAAVDVDELQPLSSATAARDAFRTSAWT